MVVWYAKLLQLHPRTPLPKMYLYYIYRLKKQHIYLEVFNLKRAANYYFSLFTQLLVRTSKCDTNEK